MAISPTERSLAAKVAAHESWARTPDRSARTLKARQALERKFLTAANGDPKVAEQLRAAHFARMRLRSLRSRRRAQEAREKAERLEREADRVEAELANGESK
jgi:hypothetical protein